MTVNMIFILVCLFANAIFCNGLPQGYCAHDMDADEMVDCDEAGDQMAQPWSYGAMRGAAPYHQASMLKNANDESYYESPRRLMNKAIGNQFRSQNPSYMTETRNLYENYAPQRDSVMSSSYQQNPMSAMRFAPENARFAKSSQMQQFSYPGHHYYHALSAYDEPSYYHPMEDYHGYSPDEYADYDDCSNGKCPQKPAIEATKQSSDKKLKKNHDKRHNPRLEKMAQSKIINQDSMIHADEIEEETTDKDSWGIERREKQKNKDQKTAEDNIKEKRSVEEKQEDLERSKKEVKKIDSTEIEGEKIQGENKFVHQIMHIPRKNV